MSLEVMVLEGAADRLGRGWTRGMAARTADGVPYGPREGGGP